MTKWLIFFFFFFFDLTDLLWCQLLPIDYSSFHVDCLEALCFKEVGCVSATYSWATVDEICVFFVENADWFWDLIEGNVLWIWDMNGCSFKWGAHVNDFEFGVGGVECDEFECFSSGDAHNKNEVNEVVLICDMIC